MSYDQLKPADNEFLSDSPAIIRENNRALKDDRIVDAGKLQGIVPGNASGNIPLANGNTCTNLNAEKLQGKVPADFAIATHVHGVATTSNNGFLSNTDKIKIDGIQSLAEVNQNTFSNIMVGATTIQADSKTDTLELAAGTGITLIPDAVNDKVTVSVTQDGHSHAAATSSANGFMSATDKSKINGIASGAEVNQNTFANIVAGGVTIQADNKTDSLTINAGAGVTITGDATNDALTIAVTDNGHTHTNATTSAAGFMSAGDKSKFDGVAVGAEVNQNSFANILVGSTTVAADSKTDTLELVAGSNISITPDATNDRITFANTYSYTHPTGDGNLHVPATSITNNGKVLKAGSTAGSIAWGTLTATDITNTAAGNISATTVQAAINELDTEKVNTSDVVTVATANKILKLNASGYLPTSITGNAATATKLSTTKTISLTGDVIGSASFDGSTNVSITATISDDSHSHTIDTISGITPSGVRFIDSSTTFSVPVGVTSVVVTCVGGGGAGGGTNAYYDYESTSFYTCGGGGGGGAVITSTVTVIPGSNITVTIGNGGTYSSTADGIAGGTTSFGTLLSAPGGAGGYRGSSTSAAGGAGGASGGLGATSGSNGGNKVYTGGNGGCNSSTAAGYSLGTYGRGGHGGDGSGAETNATKGVCIVNW